MCACLSSPSLFGSQVTPRELLWRDKPQLHRALQQVAFTDEDGRHEVQLHIGALPPCRLSDLCFCVVKHAAHIAFSQVLLRNAILARAGWGMLSVISITQALTAPPFSFRDARCLGSSAVLMLY